MNNEEIKRVIDWVIADLQHMSYELEPENVKKSNMLFDNVVSALKHDVHELISVKSCLKEQEETKVTNPVILDPKAQDYIYCMFLSDYYKKKCEFIEAIECYGYACEKRDEDLKKEWFTKILGYHSELVDILMRGILKEREHGDKS